MFALTFEGRTLARGSRERMIQERVITANFSGRDISAYKIEAV